MGVEGYKWWLWHSKVHRRWQVNVCIDFGICQWMPKIFGYTWHNQPSIHWLYRNTWHHVAPPTTWEEPSRLPYFPSQRWPSCSGPARDTAAASNGLHSRGRQLRRPLTGRLQLPPETPRQLLTVTSATGAAAAPTGFWRYLPTAATYKRIPHPPTDHCCATSHTVNIWRYKKITARKDISLKGYCVW